ncbi:hypothetical protein CEXT_576721 [Caerostris extrusa]|uniref:Uncharacterized protein n=1 Tax=Caerostris extrusa TaxID=172846 RepID=A0AAV4UJC5_CAEEX|nr:hypothetical protein CEXT_576721 [Caerostris extrusa]
MEKQQNLLGHMQCDPEDPLKQPEEEENAWNSRLNFVWLFLVSLYISVMVILLAYGKITCFEMQYCAAIYACLLIVAFIIDCF